VSFRPLSRNTSGHVGPKLQAAFLPDEETGHHVLQGWAVIGKLQFDDRILVSEAIGIRDQIKYPRRPIFLGKVVVEAKAADIRQRGSIYRPNVRASHLG